MIKAFLITLVTLSLLSCAPVLRKDLMREGVVDFRLSEVKEDINANKGRLFILGGKIVKTTVTKEGSLIEALYVPVNSMGYLYDVRPSDGRFLAIYRNGLLDPLIFSENREVTIAGRLLDTRKGMIDEAEYTYPFFEIEQIYLWEKQRYYHGYPYYYRPYYYPHFHFWYYD